MNVTSKVHLVGGGTGALAAAFIIRGGGHSGENITQFLKPRLSLAAVSTAIAC